MQTPSDHLIFRSPCSSSSSFSCSSVFTFVFWFLQTSRTNISIRRNPVKNIVYQIFWFIYQPIYTNFNRHKFYKFHQNRQSVVMCVAFHPIFPLLATGSSDGSIILYNLTTSPPKFKCRLQDHIITVKCLIFYSKRSLLVTVSANTEVIIYDISTSPSTIQQHFQNDLKCVSSFTFHPSLLLFATNTMLEQYVIVLYNFTTAPPTSTSWLAYNQRSRGNNIAFHPCLSLLATSLLDHSVIFYDISVVPPRIKYDIKHHTHSASSLAFHPLLPLFATVSADCSTYLYEIPTVVVPLPSSLTIKYCLTNRQNTICSVVVFHPTLLLLATGLSDTSTIIYDLTKLPPTIRHHMQYQYMGSIRCIAFHPSLPLCMTSSSDHTSILYNLNKYQKQAQVFIHSSFLLKV